MIDVQNGQIDLQLGKLDVRFNLEKSEKKPTIDGHTFWVDTLTDVIEESVNELHTEDSFQITVTDFDTDHGLVSDNTLLLAEKNDIKEVLDGDVHSTVKKIKTKKKVKEKEHATTEVPELTLIPQGCDGSAIEYKVKRRGKFKPFSRVRAILTPEFKEKGQAAVKRVMNNILQLKVFDGGACFGASSTALPD